MNAGWSGGRGVNFTVCLRYPNRSPEHKVRSGAFSRAECGHVCMSASYALQIMHPIILSHWSRWSLEVLLVGWFRHAHQRVLHTSSGKHYPDEQAKSCGSHPSRIQISARMTLRDGSKRLNFYFCLPLFWNDMITACVSTVPTSGTVCVP